MESEQHSQASKVEGLKDALHREAPFIFVCVPFPTHSISNRKEQMALKGIHTDIDKASSHHLMKTGSSYRKTDSPDRFKS